MSEPPNTSMSFAQRTREALYAKLSAAESTEQDDLRSDMDFNEPIARKGPADPEEDKASVSIPIASSNKGFQLLKKMGWVENTPLGLRGVGIIEPVQLKTQMMDFAGLGKEEQDEEYIGELVDRVPKHLRPDRPDQLEAEEGAPAPSDDALRRLAAEEARQVMQQSFSCAICNKQYKRSTELDTHLGGYEHHHKVRSALFALRSRSVLGQTNSIFLPLAFVLPCRFA
jgi:hypothetical protein